MITRYDQLIRIDLDSSEVNYIRDNARKAEICGRSTTVQGKKREEDNPEHQFTAQLGEYAGVKYMEGTPFPKGYMMARHFANIYPVNGDGGTDVPGANIDFKTSYMDHSANPLRFHLYVHPSVLKLDMIYVRALIRKNSIGLKEFKRWPSATVFLIGWATGKMFPKNPYPDDGPIEILRGKLVIDNEDLLPLMPIVWNWKGDKEDKGESEVPLE